MSQRDRSADSLAGLNVRRFDRDEDWFEYIYNNRNYAADTCPDADVVIGPIANDTIFDTFGIITSGVLTKSDSMQLLLMGPKYEQIALKSEKAASQLKWLGGRVLSRDEVARYRAIVEAEQAEYQKLFAETMVKL